MARSPFVRSHSFKAFERHGVGADLAAVDQDTPDGCVRISVLAIVSDTHRLSVRQFDASGALYLQKEDVDRVLEIHQFQALAGEATLLDFGAREIRLQSLLGFAHVGGGRGLGAALTFGNHVHEVWRAAVDRHFEERRLRPRALHQRFVISRQQSTGLRPRHPMWTKVRFKETACLPARSNVAGPVIGER